MASTTSCNALNSILTLNFKECGWDVAWLHTTFDALLVATLTAAQEAPNSQSQLLYLMNAYCTKGKNKGWMAHVCMLDSQVSSGTITEVALLQESAKTFIHNWSTPANGPRRRHPKMPPLLLETKTISIPVTQTQKLAVDMLTRNGNITSL